MLDKGITADGPSTKHAAFPGTLSSNCTKYASSKRWFPNEVNGNAYQWADQAGSANFEVGSVPIKGAILVMQPGINIKTADGKNFTADATNGHVAFVERVELQDDGSYLMYITDNGNRDSTNPLVLTVRPGDEGIKYIYEQKSPIPLNV